MRPVIVFLFFTILFLSACNNNKTEKAASLNEPSASPGTDSSPVVTTSPLNGSWDLINITDLKIALSKLYPRQKPNLNFDLASGVLTGSTACNRFSGPVKIIDSSISIGELGMTKIACPGDGEQKFLEALKKTTTYALVDSVTLSLRKGDAEVMRFSRKQKVIL
ncbi:MAG: META domain-containing protein [Chitinophagaceae bacterium]|nr:META domain-containing protein [Chitinophagaceae bacterium]